MSRFLTLNCRKRDGSVVPFDRDKIAAALGKCFSSILGSGLVGEDHDCLKPGARERITRAVVNNLIAERQDCPDVEHVQRLVIRQLWSEGFWEAAEHYQNYREERRKLRITQRVTQESLDRVKEDQKHFPSDLQYYQFMSKFSRWKEDGKRRETWGETVHERVCPWLFAVPGATLTEHERAEMSSALYNLESLPAMRVIQMAGPALDRCSVGVFNCSYLPIQDVRSFPELLYILMQGCGVGFSVESDYVSQLPRVKKQTGHKVELECEDSTEGWCDTYFKHLEYLWNGYDTHVGVSKIRPKGSRLKTKGGRASGPDPFLELITFSRNLLKSRQGRYLEDIDAHDLACMTGKIVQVGGVRRAAEISLSDLNSTAMRNAKSGNWYSHSVHRTMANNSAVYDYDEDVPVETFMEEWLALVKSKRGERGIFNRRAVLKYSPARRNWFGYKPGVNPCVPADTWVMTDCGPRRVSSLVGESFTAVVDGRPFSATPFVKTGTRRLLKMKLSNGVEVRATKNHMVLTARVTNKKRWTEWKEMAEVRVGDKVILHNHRGLSWCGSGTESEGYLLGSLVGDGCFSEKKVCLDFWGETREHMRDVVLKMVHSEVGARSDCKGSNQIARVGKVRIQSRGVRDLALRFGITPRNKVVTDKVEQSSSDFHRGFLRGWFDADGCVVGSQRKGVSVRLTSVKLGCLIRAQRMLLRLGINSVIYQDRTDAGQRSMPDGKGGMKEYWCQSLHELVVANDNLQVFSDLVGFVQPDKQRRLLDLLSSYKRKMNRERFAERVVSVEPDGVEDVYDCAVPGPEAFDANGAYVHNCAEICLRPWEFCNLSIAVARPDDTAETLRRKVRIATYFGKIQSLCTNFKYIRPEWRKNCVEERLLGVDINGHADCPLLRFDSGDRKDLLDYLKREVLQVDRLLSSRWGVNESAAATCVKPSGDSSIFLDCASGVSPRFSPYQMRWVREAKTTPVARFLRDSGVPCADAPEAPGELFVFGFPRKAPPGCTLRDDMTAIDQLENWLEWKTHWAEHSVSATVYVEEKEWPAVGAWVYKHIDMITGLSFLPKDNGTYTYAPNEEISQAKYEEVLGSFPDLNWGKLVGYEDDDETTSRQTFACVGGSCD